MEVNTLKNAYKGAQSEASRYLAPREWISWLILSLRFLALTLALMLSFFDRSQEGVIVPITYVTLAAVAYNVILVVLARYVRWLRQTLNVLVLDTMVTTMAIYLTGGYHSGFFIIYFFIITGAAFYLNLVGTTFVALILSLIYLGACFVNPAGIWSANALFIMAGKIVLLLLVAALCGLLLEQLRREHLETERERALGARLAALNDLFQELTASLELERTMQTVVEASRQLLAADTAVILLRGEDGRGMHLAASRGLRSEARWDQPALDKEAVQRLATATTPYLVDDVADQPPAIQRLLEEAGLTSLVAVALVLAEQTMGILCAGRRSAMRFSEDDVAFLNALAQEAALAIRNARLYEREREQVQQLRTLEALQASFVSVVSHELRTPLTCIKTSVDMLENPNAIAEPDVRRELLDTICHHTGRLETMVEDLLDATRLEAGQLTLSLQPTDLGLLTERTVRAFAPLAENRKQTLELDIPEKLEPIPVDRHRMEQVLTNLISNAHRFAGKGGNVRVALASIDDHLEFTVADDGPGIPEAEHERIFEKFYVVNDGRGLAGVGLGLYIARQLVELHDGRIWVESVPGEGSRFHVAIPKKREEPYPSVDLVEPVGDGQVPPDGNVG
ncbi:MAG: GAF domain-containing protein [Anaerolineae bacterium]|nr:GAF domain-containing protein [Anaerolineae bacterium]NIN94396.1 GAF domain-containing protein [Anaerolineae bacterium]NIQ77462.1 GAF domain-containing protein [Anaerolineae bacterium]